MHPILFSIGPVTVYSYGFMLAAAFIVAASLASRRATLFNLSKEHIGSLALVLLIFGIIGSRALYVFLNIGYFSRHPLEVFLINRGGLVFYGGFLSAFLAGIIFAGIYKLPILDTADLVVPFMALAHSIGRIGCFLNGCCYGKPTSSALGVVFPYTDVKVYPTQLFSSAGLFIIFLVLFYLQGRRRFRGQVLYSYLILYGMSRFSIDFLRGDLQPFFLNLTVTQIISLVVAGIGLWRYLRR